MVLPASARAFRNTVGVRTSEGGSRVQALPAAPSPQIPQIGDVLDSRYRITGVLGSGGMGCVYLAEHVSIRRPLALKLLHPEVGEVDEFTKRFEREAFAIGRVDHPNCVNVSDFGKLDDGTFYMVLELLDGVLLSDLLERQERVEWRRAMHIARHVLSALSSAHAAGIIHRDVKPENVILVEQDGDRDFAKILDFGIAKLHDDAKPETDTGLLTNDAKLTQQGVTVGTPTYIAPEQAYGLPIDGRADLYSLSVMLYEMVTGVPPFDSDEVGTLLRMHVSAIVPTFGEVAPDLEVPEALEQLILHGLQKKPERRIRSARAYIDRINQILSAEREGDSGPRKILSPVFKGTASSLSGTVARVVGTKKRAAWAISAAIVGTALIAVLAFALTGRDPEGSARGGRFPLAPETQGPVLQAAAQMLEQGRPEEAASYLMGQEPDVRGQPHVQMVLGHALVNAKRSTHALKAYETAVSLEPKLAKDKLMRSNVELMLTQTDPRVVDAALDFLGVLVSVARDGAAADQLVDLASSSKVSRRRHKAVSVAEEVGVGDRIDRLGSYILDLQQGPSCADRKAGVAKLRALGDASAIPALRKARTRIRTEGGPIKKKVNTNACLRAEADEAIRYLRGL